MASPLKKLLSALKRLTLFDRVLWACSALAVAVGFLLVKSDDYLTLIASLIGVSALIFLAKGHILGQLLTIVFALFYGVISFLFRYYGETITYVCMTAPTAFIALISWLKHPYKRGEEVRVAALKKKHGRGADCPYRTNHLCLLLYFKGLFHRKFRG